MGVEIQTITAIETTQPLRQQRQITLLILGIEMIWCNDTQG